MTLPALLLLGLDPDFSRGSVKRRARAQGVGFYVQGAASRVAKHHHAHCYRQHHRPADCKHHDRRRSTVALATVVIMLQTDASRHYYHSIYSAMRNGLTEYHIRTNT